MSDSRQSAMVKLFLASYDDFKARLKRRLGSEDLACDVLHETYLRVDRLDDALEVKKPQAYLFRIALNIAADRREGDARLLTGEEVAELLQVADEGLTRSASSAVTPRSVACWRRSANCRRGVGRFSSPRAWKRRRMRKSPVASAFPPAPWRRNSRPPCGSARSA